MSAVTEVLSHGRTQLGKVIVGQSILIDQVMMVLLCNGHALMEGAPGLAKTLLVKATSNILQVGFQRVQCTSDLMPADILGTNVLNSATASFNLHKGPIFTDLLLVDEINRMPPRTQAALLEAMEERQVTIDGVRHALSTGFSVFATQNPVEFEGTYPLPEAQLDRFLAKLIVDYPEADDEIAVLQLHHKGFDIHTLGSIGLEPFPSDLLSQARQEIKNVQVEPALFSYLTKIIRRTREWPSIALGASPRAAINLLLFAKANAAADGREFLIPDDVKATALPVLRHRIMLKPDAELEGMTSDHVLTDVLKAVEVPR